MKIFFCCLFVCGLWGCTPQSSQETSSQQDSTAAKLRVDSVSAQSTVAAETPKAPVIIPDSIASVLGDSVTAQFERFYADSASYYKVVLVEYYDEYEGQDEMKITRWYYDKNFSVVYSRFYMRNGAMDMADIDEYLIKNGKIVGLKAETDADGSDRKYFRWDQKSQGVVMIWSPYFKKITYAEEMAADYITLSQKVYDAYVQSMPNELDKDKIVNDDGDVITILTETPKASELMDYTRVTISKVLYDKMKADKN